MHRTFRRQEEQALQSELLSLAEAATDQSKYLRLAETLADFRCRLRARADSLDVDARQKILRLLVKEILVGKETVTIRHSIPTPHPGPGLDASPGPNPAPPIPPSGPSYLLRTRSHQPPVGQSVSALTRLICGCGEIGRICRSSGTRMTLSSIAGQSGEANQVRVKLAARLKQCGLELHPEKTKVVYCKDANRKEIHPNEKFDFLGFTFRPRRAKNRKGKIFWSFSPAISKSAAQTIRDEIRGWKLHRCTGQAIVDLARKINPKLRGWFNYYGRFTPSALRPIERHVGPSLVRWACRRYKKLRNHRSRAWAWLMQVLDRQPDLLALWEHQRSRFSP